MVARLKLKGIDDTTTGGDSEGDEPIVSDEPTIPDEPTEPGDDGNSDNEQ